MAIARRCLFGCLLRRRKVSAPAVKATKGGLSEWLLVHRSRCCSDNVPPPLCRDDVPPPPLRNADGLPGRLRIGPAHLGYIFCRMYGDIPLYRCHKPADYYDAGNQVLYLARRHGLWLIAHGPPNLNCLGFADTRRIGGLATVWGSEENILEKGLHYWETWDAAWQCWTSSRLYESVPLKEDTDTDGLPWRVAA